MNNKNFQKHFRYYNKSGHPALIIGERKNQDADEWHFRNVTHSEKSGKRHKNEVVTPNPNPKDKRPMYIEKHKRYDKKKYFGKQLKWKYPNQTQKKETVTPRKTSSTAFGPKRPTPFPKEL